MACDGLVPASSAVVRACKRAHNRRKGVCPSVVESILFMDKVELFRGYLRPTRLSVPCKGNN